MTALILLAVAWGAFAFGAVYPWAYWPLFALQAALGLAGLFATRGSPLPRSLVIVLGIIAGLLLLQLLPLPRGVIAAFSPATDAFLQQYDIAYATGTSTWHSLAIHPSDTLIALAGYVSLTLLMLGASRTLSVTSVRALVNGIAGIAMALAVCGVVQKSTGTMKIYGLWTPYHHPYQIYGPFVNRNHFAGWMTMAIPLGLGSLCSAIFGSPMPAHLARRTLSTWLVSRDARHALWAGFGVMAMGLSLVLTQSRSGILSSAVAVAVIVACLLTRESSGRVSRALAVAVVLAVMAGSLVWAGVDPMVNRFLTGESVTGRLPGWRAALRIAHDFPLMGVGANGYQTATVLYGPGGPAFWDAAHNEYLQAVAEGGALMVLAAIGAATLFIREIRRQFRESNRSGYWIRVGAMAGLAGILLQECVDFSLQIEGNATLFAVLLAVAIHHKEPRLVAVRPE